MGKQNHVHQDARVNRKIYSMGQLISGTVRCQDIKSNGISLHKFPERTDIKTLTSLWKSHQSVIKYLESLGTGWPGWHIVLGKEEISQILGLQRLIRAGCTATDSITVSDTLDPGKTNGSGPLMTKDRPELPALSTTLQLTYLSLHLPSHTCLLPSLVSEYQGLGIDFYFSGTPFGLWYSLNERKELILHPVLAASAEPWLTVRQH